MGRRSTRFIAEPSAEDVLAIMRAPKDFEESEQEVAAELRRDGAFVRGSKDCGWSFELYRPRHGRLLAKLHVGGKPRVGLDFHEGPSVGFDGQEIPGGWYHWDVYPPMSQAKYRLRAWDESAHPNGELVVLHHLHAFWRVRLTNWFTGLYDHDT